MFLLDKQTKSSIIIDIRYNCYKLLGYDIMLDSTFRPHLLEVNSRPSVYQERNLIYFY